MSAGGGVGQADQSGFNRDQFIKKRESVLSQVTGDDILDDESKAELLKRLESVQVESSGSQAAPNEALAKLMEDASAAKEGATPLAEQRLKTKALRSALSNQPGRSQTVLSRG